MLRDIIVHLNTRTQERRASGVPWSAWSGKSLPVVGKAYLYAMAALVGPVKLMNSKRLKPASLHQERKSAPV
jgi:hypothetical protein